MLNSFSVYNKQSRTMNTFQKRTIAVLSFIFYSLTLFSQTSDTLPSWAFGGFVRPANVNPIIAPKSETTFTDPMSGKEIHWESNDAFNPGATIKGDKIIILYRAEDKSGVAIGERTSRLGYAESSDGITVIRRPEPVLYPAADSQKEYEWPGGCEDPRVAVTDDGLYVVFYTQWNRKV